MSHLSNLAPTMLLSLKFRLTRKSIRHLSSIANCPLIGSVLCASLPAGVIERTLMIRYRRYASSQSSLVAKIRKVQKVKLIQRSPYVTLNLVMKDAASKENGEHLSQGVQIEVPVYVIWHDYTRLDGLGRISLTLNLGESMQVRIQNLFWAQWDWDILMFSGSSSTAYWEF